MRKYVARRVLLFIPTLIGVSLAIFLLMRVLPGDVAEVLLSGPKGEGTFSDADLIRVRKQLGLDRPIYMQYGEWAWDMVRGNLGNSFTTSRPVAGELKRQLPVTLQLALFTFIVVLSLAIPIGILAAIKHDSWLDFILRGWAIMGLAMPTFFVGLLVILVLSVYFKWMPPVGFTHLWQNPTISLQQILPASIGLGFHSNGLMLRMMRTQLLEVMGEDYIRTARAKGLAEQVVIWRHSVRNALLPVVTLAGFQIGALLSGAVVIETVFSIPGVGRGLVNALNSRDLPVIQVYIMYFAILALMANLIVDMAYAWLDPRIRYD